MNPESPTVGARLRASFARVLSLMGGGARRMESWTARSTRSLILGVVVLGVVLTAGLGMAFEGRHALAWFGGRDRPPHERLAPPDHFVGKPQGGGFVGKPHAKPEAPRPGGPGGPPPPPPPAPPAP